MSGAHPKESPHGQDEILCDVLDVYDEVFIKET